MPQHALIRDALSALPILAVLAAVYLLPPDTSLGEVRRTGALHVCLPPLAPPFVTGDAKAPGIDIELLQALAGDLGLMLAPVPEPAMGRDFNPRGWHVTRRSGAPREVITRLPEASSPSAPVTCVPLRDTPTRPRGSLPTSP